jgi:8-oxo-dGTP pyrophosphatase MutT (NUDIX family)
VSLPFAINEIASRLTSRTATCVAAAQRASVAIVLGQLDGELCVLLIRRAESPLDPWSGQMALPGGRREPDDSDDLMTAIRETWEEVGLDLTNSATLLGRLDDVRATARGRPVDMAISPFVFSVKSLSPIVPTAEVMAAYWVPVLPLFNGRAAITYQADLPDGRVSVAAWNVQGNAVWGLTYRMLDNLLSLMRACPLPHHVTCP